MGSRQFFGQIEFFGFFVVSPAVPVVNTLELLLAIVALQL